MKNSAISERYLAEILEIYEDSFNSCLEELLDGLERN